ncbi:MAG: EthD domain-containing protein [Ferruginibacter sp.]
MSKINIASNKGREKVQGKIDTFLLKVSCLLTRRADLTHEEFLKYWTEKHTPMLAKPQPGAPKVYRYVQLHPINDKVPGLNTAPYDAVAEIWFDKLEDAAAMFTSDHYNSIVGKDEENFLDRSKTTFIFSYEKIIF